MKQSTGRNIITGIIVTVVGGIILAIIVGEGRFAPTSSIPEETFENSNIIPDQPTGSQPVNSVTTAPPQGVRNPTYPVEMGTPILVGDYSLIVTNIEPNSSFPDFMQVEVVITYYGTGSSLFRYQRSSISLSDDQGTTYPYGNTAEKVYENLQVSLESGQPTVFESTRGFNWSNTTLASFEGPIPASVQTLFVNIDGFGPFSGIVVQANLN